MAEKYKDYPLYSYDEPATYEDFSGGINSDPSNEHLMANEMRDCVNMTYLSGALVKRQGAKAINKIHYAGDNINNIQGVFLYTNNDPGENGNRFKISYLIVAGDGKLFYGPYEKNGDIRLKRLHIKREYERGNRVYDFTNPWCDLPETENRDGYRITTVTEWKENSSWPNMYDKMEDELVFQNYRPVEAATINENKITKRSANDAEGALTNKLYVATGTKLIMVYFDYKTNDLVATAIEPYIINGTEMQNIGENYMSPYSGLCKGTQENSVTTSIFGLQAEKVYKTYKSTDDDIGDHLSGTYRAKVNGEYPTSFTLYPLMNFQSGDDRNNYYYKWEKLIDDEWITIFPFADQFLQDISKYWQSIDTPDAYVADELADDWSDYSVKYLKYPDRRNENLGYTTSGKDKFFFKNSMLYQRTSTRYAKTTLYDVVSKLTTPLSDTRFTSYNDSETYSKYDSITNRVYSYVNYCSPLLSLLEARTFNMPQQLGTGHHEWNLTNESGGTDWAIQYGLWSLGGSHLDDNYTTKTYGNFQIKYKKVSKVTTEESSGFRYLVSYCTTTDPEIYYNGNYIGKLKNTQNGTTEEYSIEHTQIKIKNTASKESESFIKNSTTLFTLSWSRISKQVYYEKENSDNTAWYTVYSGNNNKTVGGTTYTGTVPEWASLTAYPENFIVTLNGTYYKCREPQPDSFGSFKSLKKPRYYEIAVDDLDDKIDNKFSTGYRITFAKSFEATPTVVNEWVSGKQYRVGDYATYGKRTYICINEIEQDQQLVFSTEMTTKTSENVTQTVQYWREVLNYVDDRIYNIDDGTIEHTYDYVIDKVDGEYFGQAQTVGWTELKPNEKFLAINSCNRIISDGNKLLLYGDTNHSGWWYKSVISNPGYFTDRGCLSFKTTKNEEVVKVVPFQGNIIVFANNPELGGSIHLVSGNGDDYDPGGTQSYYSPYQRKTINSAVSCSNGNTVQVCDNILVFKYYDRLYYIAASDLNQDIVNVTSCNDRVKTNRDEYAIKWGKTLYDTNIPWDDDSCVSEVTDTYYGILWPAKFDKDEYGEEYMVHPGIRAKMYYKMANQIKDNSYVFPWLKDVSDGIFDAKNIINLKGRPVYYFHDQLVSMSEKVYNDLGIDYPCKIQLRGVDLNYPKLYKMIDSVILYYHRNQYKTVDIKAIIKNEAGYKLIDETDTNRLKSIGDFKSLRAGENNQFIEDSNFIKVGGDSIADTKVINPAYKFPCLLADFTIEANCPSIEEQERREDKLSGVFSLSSVTFRYTTIETPDTTPIDLYKNIIRPREV